MMKELRDKLMSLFLVRMFVGNLGEIAVPIVMTFLRSRKRAADEAEAEVQENSDAGAEEKAEAKAEEKAEQVGVGVGVGVGVEQMSVLVAGGAWGRVHVLYLVSKGMVV